MSNRSLEAIGRELESETSPDRRVELLLQRAIALARVLRLPEARDALVAADELAARTPLPHRLPDVHHARAMLLYSEDRLPEAVGAVVNAREIASAYGRDEFALRCDALLSVFLTRQEANIAALPIARRALEGARAAHDLQAEYFASVALGAACQAAGDFERGLLLFSHARECASALADQVALAVATERVTLAHLLKARAAAPTDDDIAALEQAIDAALRLALDPDHPSLRIAHAALHELKGETAPALDGYRAYVAAVDARHTPGLDELATLARAKLALACLEPRDPVRAHELRSGLLEFAERTGRAHCLFLAHEAAAQVAQVLDEIAAAEVHRAAAAAALAQVQAQRAPLAEMIARELAPHSIGRG